MKHKITQWLFLIALAIGFQSVQAKSERVALVIGNSDYTKGQLKNPVNDATLMTRTLQSKGFRVTTLKNGTRRQMIEAIRDFTGNLEEDSVGLFYFAGHGIEIGGNNYLIPVDANIEIEADVEFESINAGRVLAGLKQSNNGLNLVVLDACRNNPYAKSFRSSSRGLSRMKPTSGSLILYATEPGSVAADGRGNNGVFTTHLVNAINQDGLSIEKVFKATARNVNKATQKKQTPYIEGVVLGEFYFSGGVVASGSQSIKVTSLKNDSSGEHERMFWNDVRADPSQEMYKAYILQFPNGFYSRIAKLKLNKFDKNINKNKIVLEPPEIKTVLEPPGINEFSISGTYQSENISGSYFIFNMRRQLNIELSQNGDNIKGQFIKGLTGKFSGVLVGDRLEFDWFNGKCSDGYGEMIFNAKRTIITGRWSCATYHDKGDWKFFKG